MTAAAVAKSDVVPMTPPRLSSLGAEVVTEIAERLDVDPNVVMRAMLHVSLNHQRELAQEVRKLEHLDVDQF